MSFDHATQHVTQHVTQDVTQQVSNMSPSTFLALLLLQVIGVQQIYLPLPYALQMEAQFPSLPDCLTRSWNPWRSLPVISRSQHMCCCLIMH